jgi:heme-degrading monooxygenase HmoA
MLPFFFHAFRSSRQAKAASGHLKMALLPDAHRTFWTCTVWTDEAAMKSFMLSGAHREAMPRLIEWCDEASVTHWQQDTDQLPDWNAACDRMQREGRRSKVRYPSPAQDKFEIPPPRT